MQTKNLAYKLLILTLVLSIPGELAVAALGFFAPAWMLGQMKIAITPDTLFLGHAIAWMILLIGLVLTITAWLLTRGQNSGHVLARILGAWFVFVGLAIYLKFGRPENLVADTLRGAGILLFSFLAVKEPAARR